MKLSDPQKFTPENVDGTLIALGEVVCQYSELDNPTQLIDWTSTFDDTKIYKWIRLSFDNGTTWKLQYKLHTNTIVNDISFQFIVSPAEFTNSGNTDYPKRYTYVIEDEELFNEIKYKPIGIYLEENTNNNGVSTSTSILAPIVFRQDINGYYIDILVTDLFITNNTGKICVVKS